MVSIEPSEVMSSKVGNNYNCMLAVTLRTSQKSFFVSSHRLALADF